MIKYLNHPVSLLDPVITKWIKGGLVIYNLEFSAPNYSTTVILKAV